MLCVNDQPFQLVENIGFKLFIKTIDHTLQSPCRTSIPNKIE